MRLFISYRRQDSAAWAGRLADYLSDRLGAGNVFRDIDTIRPAENWLDKIQAALQKADCTLVVIGPSWLDVADGEGQRRLDNPGDLVRVEIATALRRTKPVVPVLVGGARMPLESALPKDLRPLTQRQAVELADHRWRDDMQHLLAAVMGRVWWRRGILIGAGVLQAVFVALWIYVGFLEARIARSEAQGTGLRDAYIAKMQVGSDQCMAGIWPEGSVKGPSYAENGHMVTELCSGVSGSLNYFGRLFDDEQIWRLPPSRETAARFATVYDDTFNRSFEPYLRSGWTKPLSEAALTLASRAQAELAIQGQQIVALKQAAGSAADRLQFLQPIVTLGKFWTLMVVAAIVVWLGRGRRGFID
ncbi:MAG: toll/interleukin-1 receptor domain-containing protein [Nitrospira sp.]